MVFINSSCSRIFVAFFCVPQVLSLIPPTSIYQKSTCQAQCSELCRKEGLQARHAIRIGRQERTGPSAPMEVCCAEKQSPFPKCPLKWDLPELPHVPQQATDPWRQDVGPASAAEHTTETRRLFPQPKNKTTQKQTKT